jgi:hypothetical protein
VRNEFVTLDPKSKTITLVLSLVRSERALLTSISAMPSATCGGYFLPSGVTIFPSRACQYKCEINKPSTLEAKRKDFGHRKCIHSRKGNTASSLEDLYVVGFERKKSE